MLRLGKWNLFFIGWIFLLSCSDPKGAVPSKPRLSGSNATKPVASGYLSGIGLRVGAYTDEDQNGIYECQSKKHRIYGNTLQYRVTGTQNGELIKIELEFTVRQYMTMLQSKELLIEAFEILYVRLTAGKAILETTVRKIPLEIYYMIYGEPFIFGTDRTLRIPVNPVELKGLNHSLERYTALITTDGTILHIQRESLTDPHEWGDPFILRIVMWISNIR